MLSIKYKSQLHNLFEIICAEYESKPPIPQVANSEKRIVFNQDISPPLPTQNIYFYRPP